MKRRMFTGLGRAAILVIFAMVVCFSASSSISDASFVYIEGVASWYSEASPGIRPTTANMEKFDHDRMTCAMWDIPFNTILEVTNVDNGKIVQVRVNDRGPAKRLTKEGRVIDLTKGAFSKIDSLDKGLTRVKIRVLETPPRS